MRRDSQRALGALATEAANPATADIDRMNPLEIARLMNEQDATVATAVRAVLPAIARAMEEIASHLASGGRLVYVGAGTSGRLGVLDASECPPTFNVPPGMVVGVIAGGEVALTRAVEEIEDDPEQGRQDMRRLGVSSRDAVVGLASSGRTPYVMGAIDQAREAGALTVAVTCNPGTPLARHADIAVEAIVGPEVVAGSTRLKAGTAQKMILNMLSTGAMILLGKTYRNLMVDLRATNSKLRDRAVRIVAAATGLDEEEARQRLDRANGEVKTAIVAVLTGVPEDEARLRLKQTGGRVRDSL